MNPFHDAHAFAGDPRGGHHRGPWGAPGWGGMPGGGPAWRGGRRMRRGDIRHALLVGLLDGPAHGYELIRRLEERTGGDWRPSAGSVYPTLQLLEEEGLLSSREEEGKRVYDLTDAGREAAEAARERRPLGAEQPGAHHDLRHAVASVAVAARQVAVAGDDTQVQSATAILTEARQRIYRLLAGE